MSNPFEKYVQASQRQSQKLSGALEKWANTPSAPVEAFDTSIAGQYADLGKPITPDPTLKSVGDYLGDTATDAAKALLTAQGVAVSAVDLGMYSLGGLGSLAQTLGHIAAPNSIPEVVVPEFGVGSKALNDTFGVNIADAKKNLGDVFYSDVRKKQEAELQAGYTESQMGDWKKSWEDSYTTQLAGLQQSGATEQQLKDFNTDFNKQYQDAAKQFIDSKQTSWDKSFGENASIVGDAFGYVADNPSLGVGAAIDSLGYLVPSMSVSRGVQALQNAAKAASVGGKAIAAGIGEGSVSSLAIAEQMRNNSDTGTIDGGKVLAAAAAGTLTGLIGGASTKLGARYGVRDIDTAGLAALGTTAATRLPALTRPVAVVGQEAGEEFLQGFGETIIPNIAEGKDPLTGLSQELALGTFAGGIMGAGMNAPSLVSGGFSDISTGLDKAKEAVSNATQLKSFENLSNPEHKNYNPAQAYNLQLKNLESADETVRTQAEASVAKLETDLTTTMSTVDEQLKNIDTALKAMPPVAQMTDAQKLEVDALTKEQGNLFTKSGQLVDHLTALADAQVAAQEHRDIKQGTQFTEEQAKADIATLTQPKPSQTVMTVGGTQIPVQVEGEPVVLADGIEKVIVNYTDAEGNPAKKVVPTSELVSVESTDTTAQQEALNRVTKHFSKYSNDDLELLATSPVLSEPQRNSLRLLTKSKRELAAVQDPSQVFDNILNGYKGKTVQESHRGLNQYTDMVNTAVATNNAQLASLALDGLGAFTDDHNAKKDAINEAYGLVQKGTYKEIRVVKTEDGTWGFIPFTAAEVRAGKNAAGVVFLEDDALKAELNAVGGLNVHINSDKPTKGRTIGAITQINSETQLIQSTFDALSSVAESFVGVAPKSVDTGTVPTVNEPVVTEPSDTTTPVDTPAPEAPVQPKVTQSDFPTWDTMTKGQEVTLYRGESSDNTKDGQWWTTNKAKAKKYGKVSEVTLPAEVIGKHAAQGQGGVDEFYFANKRPSELVTSSQDTPIVTEDAKQVPVETKAEPKAKTTDVTAPVSKALAEVLTTQQSKASDVLTELKDSDSGRLPKEYKAYLDGLIEQVVKVFPDTLIQFVKGISEIPKKYGITDFHFGKQGTFNGEKFVFVRQAEKTNESDRYETTVHEFIHVATSNYIDENPKGTQSKTVWELLSIVKAYVNSAPDKSVKGVHGLNHILSKRTIYVQAKELLAYGLTHPEIVAELKKIPYTWTGKNKGIGSIAASMLETGEPTNVYEALLAVYGNILGIEENRLESTRRSNASKVTEELPVRTGDTRQSAGQSNPDTQSNDSRGGGSNTSTESQQTSTESSEVIPLKPEFVGKVILAHAGIGKSFATKSNPDLIDGDVLYYQATNKVVDKYNKANGESVPNIKDVTGTRGVFEAWGEYDNSNPQRQAEAKRRRDEVYAQYAEDARALADAGKTILSSSIRDELIAVADIVVIQDDATFIAKNLTSTERVNPNTETDLVKIQGKIDKAKDAAKKKGMESHTLKTGEYISELIFQKQPVATENAKVTVLQGVTNKLAAAERKVEFHLRNIFKAYFTQSTTKEDAVGANPLVTVKDFINKLGTLTQVSDWINDRRKTSERQLAQVEHFKKFHAEFAKAVKEVTTSTRAARIARNQNLVKYLQDPKTGELEANVVTALALSAYSYLIKQGNKVMNTNEELEKLLRLKKGMKVPYHIAQMFRFAGQEMPIVVKALGADTAKALGLKVREDQDPTLQDRLNTSLGVLAMEAMAKAGLVVIDTLEGDLLTQFLNDIEQVRKSGTYTIQDEYDLADELGDKAKIGKFTMVRPNAKMVQEGNTVFKGNDTGLNTPELVDGLPILQSPLVNELIEVNKDTKGFLSYLFGVDVGYTMPKMESPEKFTQQEIHGTDASVPSAQVALLTEAQKHSFTMRTNTVAVLAKLKEIGANSQFLKELLGIWVDDHVLSRTHVTQRDSLQAKAQNDWTALLNGLEWADATLDEQGQYQQFYDTQFVAQNQRQHLNSNMFSAQSSQIHRAMAALTGFSTTIDLTKDTELLDLFYQAVGEGLEGLDSALKASIQANAALQQFFTVDKVHGKYYVAALKEFLQTEDSQNAISAMVGLIQGKTITNTEQQRIADFVAKGDMGVQSLQSLIALAELAIAQANETTFTTTIGFGSDGVNHGVSAANALTGVISDEMRLQTGIFPMAPEAQIQDMQTVYEKGIPDYYVDFGKVMATALTDVIEKMGGKANSFVQGMTALFPKFEAITEGDDLVDPLSMRKISKTWSIPFNYSAGKAALQRALARGFLEGVYKQMNSLANQALDIREAVLNGEMTREDAKVKRIVVIEKTLALEANLNKVLGKYGISIKLESPELLNDEAKGKFSNAVENLLMQGVIDLHGEAAWQATEQFAKDYLAVRNVYTEIEKVSFTLFNIVRNQLIAEKKLSRVGEDGKPLQTRESYYLDLTTKQLAEVDAALAAMRPMFNTALSISSESTNDANSTKNPSGVSVRKQKMQREKAGDSDRNVHTNYNAERFLGLTKTVEENAGVASSANAVQSIDAYVAAKVQGSMDALNVHDAAIFGLKDFLKGVKKQNAEHLKALTNYQLGLEHAKMLVKVYQGYKAFMATQEEALKTAEGKVKANIQSVINEANKQMSNLLKGEAIQKDGGNLKIGGNVIYKGGLIPKLQAAGLDIKSNASIEEAIGAFIEYSLGQDLKKLQVLTDTFGIHQFAGEGGMHQLTDKNRASIDEQKVLVDKAKEDLQAELTGKSVEVKPSKDTKPVSIFISFLRSFKDGIVPMAELLNHLKNRSDIQDVGARAAQGEVLKAITPLLDANTKVVYSVEDYDGYGYFDEETNTLHINAAREDSVKTSLAVHELLHAALSRRIKTLRNDIANKTGDNFEAVTTLQKLDTLRINLLAKVTDPVLRDMLKNTDEFISNGLTDSRLQRAMGNVQVAREGRTISMKFRKFVEYVGQILGFRTKEISALAAFAADTAALLETIGSVTPAVATNNGERLFSTQSAEDRVNGQSSLDIMQALPHSNTGAFNQQLDRLITDEVGQLYNQDEAAKARIDEIQTLTASDALNAGFNLSRKEQYVQQALQYAVAAYMKTYAGGANVGQLRRVYHAAKAKVSPETFHEGDWATATQQEKDIAKAKYDFMFDATKEGYMARFVSMALASESVNGLLDIALPLTKPNTQDKTWFETVNDWVSYVMAWLTNKYVRLNPVAGASNQLSQLMDNLVKLDIRARQEGVALHQKAWNAIGIVTTPLNNALKGTQGFLANSDALRNSRFLPIRALGAMAVLRSEEAAKAIPKLIIDMRNNQLPNTKMGEMANILLEASGIGTLRNAFDTLIRQTNLNAKNRQDIVDNVKKAVNSWFKTDLTKLQNKAVTTGLLRTDAQALLENYSVEDIVDMALHEGKLNAEIAKLKKEIGKNPNGNDMLNAAEQLGYYMVTRIGGEGLVKSALGIAIGLGTQYFTSVEEADPKLVNQLNTLVSLLAMTHVSNADKGILASIYKTDAEGIHATIQLHNGLVNDSMKDFQENPLNMVKGWMPEITNPFLEIKTADSMVQRQQMESEGWVFIDELKRDAMDKGAPKYLMKHNDIGYQRLVSGAVDLMRTSRSGTEAINRTSPKYLGITQARYRNAANRASIPNKDFDPSKQPRGLIAAYDTDGVALGYNYEMDSETRDAHLDRNHNIGDLLGTMGGLNYYKPAKAKQSNKVAEVLFDDYKENYSQNPNAYLKLSHKSSDPKVVEMWRMLPQDFRQRATELYGKGNPIIIRNEAFNMAFGFKKFSVVANAFDTKAADRNKFQSGFVGFTTMLRGSTAQADFAKAEHVTQEIVKAIKDFIVIRSGTTMMWNIFANVLMLMANGINPFTIIKDWVFAVTNVRAYQKLNSQLIQAQANLVAGKEPTAIKQQIGALKAELKANPLSEYINAGLLSSIVEDVNIHSGDYTYVSAFKQSVDEKTQWIPKPVKTAAKVLTIAPSTKLYQFLATTTQLSDFVAKYSMSQHLQSKGVSKSDSIVEASQTFINYDVPTSQGLQYANDMGLFMFTKFFLRIQAVLFKLLGKRAGSVIAQHLLVENLTGAEGILSPMMFGHIGNNPIEASVFGLPSAFFSIGTVDAVTDYGTPF